MLRKIQRVGKKAAKFQYTATYQSVVVECTTKDKWRPSEICVSWTRRGRRLITELRPWQPSPDNKVRGVVIWPDPEVMEVTITLYKGPKDQSYETKEWDFAVIDVDQSGKRKVLATAPINMVRYASSLPYEHDLHLRLKPVSRKIKAVILDVAITSEFLREGKATDDDMMSIASMMSVSNLSTIGFLEDEEDDDYSYMVGFRSISPPQVPEHILSTDELLKWAQELTKDLPDIKITNMTTSWRSGMGFLAIIHHFRPDLLPDFDVLSPNSIKENNRMAFNIARSLGVACPLTPNMMVTTTVPDKLSVTSFVYLMYQYFTQDSVSAIAREAAAQGNATDGRGTSPTSPFDISQFQSQFQMFSNSISPVTTPTAQTSRIAQYSRHLQGNVQTQPGTAEEILPADGSLERRADVCTNEGNVPADVNQLELDSNKHAQCVANGKGSSRQLAEHVNDCDNDREAELENINADTDEESSQTNGSITSLLDNNAELPSEIRPASATSSSELSSANLYTYTPGKDQSSLRRATSTVTAGNGKPAGRKLPTTPVATSSPKLSDKKEEIRRQAQAMLRRHKLDKFKMSQNISLDSSMDSQGTSKYRKQAMDLLSQAFGTQIKSSPASRLEEAPKVGSGDASSDIFSCEGSSTSKSVGSEELLMQPESLQNGDREAKGDVSVTAQSCDAEKRDRKLPVLVDSDAKPEGECENVVCASSGESSSTKVSNGKYKKLSGNDEVTTPSEVERNGRLANSGVHTGMGLTRNKKHSPPVRRYSESSINSDPRSLAEKEALIGGRDHQVGARLENEADSSSSPKFRRRNSSTDRVEVKSPEQHVEVIMPLEKTKKKVLKPAPAVRPIPVRPSSVLQRMLEEKEKEQQQKLLELDLHKQKDGSAEDAGDGKEEEDEISSRKNSRSSRGCTPAKKRLPSPSACNQQSDGISQDLLVTQSEYVKVELRSLQADVQDLERRAQNIEANIRVSMSTMNKEEEESLMQEWFVLLNRKNALIKRQIQLNMIEKEEELEKKQFFLNKELRPLNALPEEQKSEEQKKREDHLLKELFELIDERDRLEKRKMACMKTVNYEESLMQTQAQPAVVNARTVPRRLQGASKDCVIS